ncbi:hypothetical protein HK107_12240 [Parvularcula sp. ZS-1/3]|uniref:Response regulatory domain-containing protein n=1 Tax=Parvularcula mediterranea TaxID=2732508 RepID=A0A7Y3W6A9_9PROT|nr:hypothetical protein [Parvularcula mediterranea]NNU17091.1 hypothetical protein [Parvularcula mediterranea]
MGILKGVHVLIAEDDFLIASSLEELIETHGGTSLTLSSVAELMRVDPTPFDVALFDRTLSDGEVDEVAQELAAKGLPYAMQSGADLSGDIPEGCIGVLGKPVSETQLVSLLSAYGKS